MKTRMIIAKVLAIAGTILVFGPILFMILTSVVGSIQSGRFLCDYLIPAELGALVVPGMLALLVAAILSGSYIKQIAWSIVAAIFAVVGGQLLAVATGLANGSVQPEQAPGTVTLVTTLIIIFDILVAQLGIMGILLSVRLFKKPHD